MKCSICTKEIEVIEDWDKGHNAKPVNDGRCCTKCNTDVVIPARAKNLDWRQYNSKHPQFNINVRSVINKEFDTIDEIYDLAEIPIIDSLKEYQLTTKSALAWLRENLDKDSSHEKITNFKEQFEIFSESVQSSFAESQVFEVKEEGIITSLLHTDVDYAEFPFNHNFINCEVPIYDRVYFGIQVGSFWTEKKEKIEESVNALKDKHKIKDELHNEIKKINELMNKTSYKGVIGFYIYTNENGKLKTGLDYFAIDNPLITGKNNKYQVKLKNFIYSFFHFINEPDVEIVKYDNNPKNDVRRQKRNLLPLPAKRIIRITGGLRVYIDKMNQLDTRSIHSGYSHKFIVRGHYMKFKNKKKYHILWNIGNNTLRKKGYIKEKDREGDNVIKKWKKPFMKGEGILIKKTYEVTDGEIKNE